MKWDRVVKCFKWADVFLSILHLFSSSYLYFEFSNRFSHSSKLEFGKNVKLVDLSSSVVRRHSRFIVPRKVVLTFKSVDETLVCDHSNESYQAVLSYGTVYYTVQVI